MEYYLSDCDIPYAKDEKGNEYHVKANGELIPADKGSIDPYDGGITKEGALYYAKLREDEYGTIK